MTRDILMEERNVDFILIVGEYRDVFQEELLGLPLKKKIEFCIDLISSM